MAGSQRYPFRTLGSWIQWIRRSTHRGAKLASSNSDGSPERPVKVLVVGANAGGGADGSPIKTGQGDVPNMCDEIGEGGASSVPILKMCDEIGEGGTSSVPIPKMCDGGTRQKEPVKLGAGGGDRSPEHVLNIGHSRLRVDHLGQLYVLDSEDEGIGKEAGLYVPDSEEEDGHGSGLVASTASNKSEKMTMATNPIIQAGSIQAAVDVPLGDVAADELHPVMVQHLKVMCVDEMICRYAGVHGLV
ncbi:unnamed protein product [Miscanthus lutarioriparius]|uniref:Uncharacterized protein n=1 Tax=Miscanthus lutarioriparius TaxID=422564 RepID=A0A811N441_9POAL|nr:unnamed protein product [Miscanthus lutarioriparius]